MPGAPVSTSTSPVVLAHATFNLYVQSGFNPLTGDTGITEYIVDEFGVTTRTACGAPCMSVSRG